MRYDDYLAGSSFTQPRKPGWPTDALPFAVQSPQRFAPLGVTVQRLASALDAPTALAFAPNGDFYVTERRGSVRLFRNGVLQDNDPLMSFPVGEAGLVGMTLDPDIARNQRAYFYGAAPDNKTPRVVRVDLFQPDVGGASVIVDGSAVSTIRDSSHIAFRSDGAPYISDHGIGPVFVSSDKVPSLRNTRVTAQLELGLRIGFGERGEQRGILAGVFGRLRNVA